MATIRVKADVACVLFWNGGQIVLSPGAAFDDADDVVKAHPEMFAFDTDVETQRITAVAVGPDAPVEEATARPGEKRSTRRPR